ncbi:hypothetical protein HU200_049335 [Digitaria exilis]|uniref:Uncharacterized protein n=1 Tax=Digitaria exilis TaxID=1010633 RepID=A0A835AR26_9POAL|nr:hypothetical protein HU200_049335 [Digitaria exilis]
MWIRKSVAHLLKPTYFTPMDPSPEFLPSLAGPTPLSTPHGSHETGNFSSSSATSKELCEQNCNPWDLIYDLPLYESHVSAPTHPLAFISPSYGTMCGYECDLDVVDDVLDNYYVDLKYRASWLFSPSMPVMLVKKTKDEMAVTRRDKVKQQATRKTVVKKDRKKIKENMEGESTKKAKVMNKKCDEGAPWSFIPPAPKHEDAEQELPKDAYPLSVAKVKVGDGNNYGVVSHDGVLSGEHNDTIAGIDEGSNGDDYDQGSSRHKINLKRNKSPCKCRSKPVKARSLKSLLEQNQLQAE